MTEEEFRAKYTQREQDVDSYAYIDTLGLEWDRREQQRAMHEDGLAINKQIIAINTRLTDAVEKENVLLERVIALLEGR